MIAITSNIHEVLDLQISLIQGVIDNPNDLVRTVAVSMLPVIRDRIHVEGKAADGSQIGNYSPGYMKVRTNIGFKSKSINRGPKKGSARPNYNRTGDSKVILSLTRQMENDFSVVATDHGYGLGFKNAENFNKSQHCEATYQKKIYSLGDSEKDTALLIVKEEVINALRY